MPARAFFLTALLALSLAVAAPAGADPGNGKALGLTRAADPPAGGPSQATPPGLIRKQALAGGQAKRAQSTPGVPPGLAKQLERNLPNAGRVAEVLEGLPAQAGGQANAGASPPSARAQPPGGSAPTSQPPAASTPPSVTSRSRQPTASSRSNGTGDATPRSPGPLAASGAAGAGATGDSPAREGPPPGSERRRAIEAEPAAEQEESSPVTRTVRDIIEVVPEWMKFALAGLALLSLLLGAGYVLTIARARSLVRQRRQLLRDVGLLQAALLPPVPEELGGLTTSVAYRPADGPGAGGDFYDALPLPDGRTGFIVGDVSGHGHTALERTALMRYTLRAYLEAGLEPRTALQVTGRVVGEGLGEDFVTVILAVHDPGSGSLTYASAGHPPPIVAGTETFEPVVAVSSPPIGVGQRTGLRQSTIPLVSGATACLYTDGLVEAHTREGLLGRERLGEILSALGPNATASELIDRVVEESTSTTDDMATCLLSPSAAVTAGAFRTEQLELSSEEAESELANRFLEECGVAEEDRERAARELSHVAAGSDGAVVSVVFGSRRTVEVLPRNVESIEGASREIAASA